MAPDMTHMHYHVAIITDVSVSEQGRTSLLHVEVALDLKALDYFLREHTLLLGDTDADMLRALLLRGNPEDAVCVFHISDTEPDARIVAEAYADRMIALCEKIHTALEAFEKTEVKYVWNESKGSVETLRHAPVDAPKQRRKRM